jgi:glycosyltransferase involved in cell wall biosynthesis
MSVSVILLAHNEAQSIGQELQAVHDLVVRRLPDCELIVAEDGSVDGTRERLLELSAEIPFRLVGGRERLGYGRALVGAIRSATRPWIFMCDGGLKHDAADFWRLYEARESYDLVVGRKTNRRDQLHRRFFTWGLNLFLRLYFGVAVRDADSGMRLLNRRVVEEVTDRPMIFRGFNGSEIVLRAIARGLRYGEVPISYRTRVGQSSGLPAKRIPRAIARLLSDARALRRELAGAAVRSSASPD